MKKSCAWLLSWVLYWVGDVLSRIMNLSPGEYGGCGLHRLYTPYNWCMTRSADIQDWGMIKAGPWHNV